MSQLIEISCTIDATGLTGKLFANGSDTVVATSSSVANQTNRKSVKIATFTGVEIGTYMLELQDAEGEAVAKRDVRIDATSGTFTELDETPSTKAEDDARQTATIAQFTLVKGATFDTSTDSLEAIRNRGDAAWVTGEGSGSGGTVVVTIPEIIAANVADESTEDLVRYRGTLWTITIEALAEIPDKCYFTLKRGGEPDARAAAQILKTDPADNANDGLKVLMGATAANAAQGSITYSSYSTTGGTRYRATASIAAVASVRFPVASYRFDFKDVATGQLLGEGTVNVIDPVTLATA